MSVVRVATAERRKEALDKTRAAGRFGAHQIPLEVAMDESLTDTFVGRLPCALMIGQQQRTTNDKYSLWLAANADRLTYQVEQAGVEDGGAWLQQQYTIETGQEP